MSMKYKPNQQQRRAPQKQNRPKTLADVKAGKERMLRVMATFWGIGAILFTGVFSASGFSTFFQGDWIQRLIVRVYWIIACFYGD